MLHLRTSPVLGALCLALLPGCRGIPSDALVQDSSEDGNTALIQQRLQAQRVDARAGGGSAMEDGNPLPLHQLPLFDQGNTTELAAILDHPFMGNLPTSGDFDCQAHPDMCKPPFNCQDASLADAQRWLREGFAVRGRPDYKLWCAMPDYQEYIVKCAAGDLDGAARAQFLQTAKGRHGDHTAEMDGSYCFIDGHCANMAVTNETTLEDAVAMCDRRFGRAAWASFVGQELGSSLPADLANGFQSQEQTRPFLLAACAMGNYHCDVRYCRETYCQDSYYIKKYGHFLQEYGWVK